MSTTLALLLTERETAIRQTVSIFTDRFNINPAEAQQLLDWILNGDIVSNSDQNVTLSVCDQTSEYSVGDEVSLASWNGDLNGGDYHVIWLEMSASW